MTKLTFLFLFLLGSCQLFEKQPDDQVIARVGEHFLYKNDILDLVGPGSSQTDSSLVVNTFIDKWATQKLLMDQAKLNLSQEKLNQYDELVANYKTDLYTKGYLDIIATQQLDEEIDQNQLESFYNQNSENFKLNEDLIQLRYIHVGNENRSTSTLKQQLFRFNDEDKKELMAREIQFKTFSLNDSVWVQANTVKDKIPVVNDSNYSELLKKSNTLELQDSLGVYLIYIKDVLLRNENAPLTYVSPTIEQIILNRRKLEIIRNLEKEILQDAIKTKKFEIYK
ncbi:peptidyl-prolyl cis-trans isomerase [Planktosalinus lacus]|uniref:Peptidylprolyl isomerase n=1 Tax=Planktosalinus lacus TaxID=1526573 RepID=A0A8J2Y8M5_9FLAO|nr:peptidyl-prolyl cis-trans isomerase [Planktosalinus lacus]GGD84099.1 hypothetical protein GCM10011312_05140 [Planktosalinus lacus]